MSSICLHVYAWDSIRAFPFIFVLISGNEIHDIGSHVQHITRRFDSRSWHGISQLNSGNKVINTLSTHEYFDSLVSRKCIRWGIFYDLRRCEKKKVSSRPFDGTRLSRTEAQSEFMNKTHFRMANMLNEWRKYRSELMKAVHNTNTNRR